MKRFDFEPETVRANDFIVHLQDSFNYSKDPRRENISLIIPVFRKGDGIAVKGEFWEEMEILNDYFRITRFNESSLYAASLVFESLIANNVSDPEYIELISEIIEGTQSRAIGK
jgi:hypothetical protein